LSAVLILRESGESRHAAPPERRAVARWKPVQESSRGMPEERDAAVILRQDLGIAPRRGPWRRPRLALTASRPGHYHLPAREPPENRPFMLPRSFDAAAVEPRITAAW